jgi:hypothetical protein
MQVDNYGVLLGKHGLSDQGVYTVVWKNWPTDMFGEYELKTEASSRTQIAPVLPQVHNMVVPDPFVYNAEYYSEAWPKMEFDSEPLSED